MTYGAKFPLKDCCRVHGISSRFPLQDTQVDTKEIKFLNAITVVLLLPEGLLAGNKQLYIVTRYSKNDFIVSTTIAYQADD